MLVLEAVEHARLYEAMPRFVRVVNGLEFEEDEDVVRVVDVSEDSLHLRLFARTRPILIEHRPPGVVVADVDSGDDERSHWPLLSLRSSIVAMPRDYLARRRRWVPPRGMRTPRRLKTARNSGQAAR